MRALILNNYDLAAIAKQLQAEPAGGPAQHLWGYLHLSEVGWSAELLPYAVHGRLKRIGARIKALGDLDQQFRVLRQAGACDVIYSAHHLTTPLLSLARRIGLLRKPLVSIAYQGPRRNTWVWRTFTKLFVAGCDRVLCLSPQLAHDLIQLGVPRERVGCIEWGVDLPYYRPTWLDAATPSPDTSPAYFVSVGKTHRDYVTLGRAFAGLALSLRICGAGHVTDADLGGHRTDNIQVYEQMLDWQQLLEIARRATAVLIPLRDDPAKLTNAIGLTALTEAMALGKPLVMTRNAYVGVDIEKEGIGLWVDPGDSDGWAKACRFLAEDPGRCLAMGRRARELAEQRFNLDRFSRLLSQELSRAVADAAAPA